MTTLKLQSGKTYITEEGYKATVECDKPGTEFPFVFVDGSDQLVGMRWTESGSYAGDKTVAVAVYDLIEEVNKLDVLLNNLRSTGLGHHPEYDFIRGFVERQRAEKKLSEDSIYEQCVKWIIDKGIMTNNSRNNELAATCYANMKQLAAAGEWTMLSQLSIFALDQEYAVVKKRASNEPLLRSLLPIIEYQQKVQCSGADGFRKVWEQWNEAFGYKFRNLPCTDMSFSVSGQDALGGGGVLEWCYDEKDAQVILETMQMYPERFTDLKVVDERPADDTSFKLEG